MGNQKEHESQGHRDPEVNYGAPPPSYGNQPQYQNQPYPPQHDNQQYPMQNYPQQPYNQQSSQNTAANQNTNVNVVTSQPGAPSQTIIIQQQEHYSMAGHYAFSCVVYWCFNWLFGAIAFFIALSGSGKPAAEAKKIGKISMILNIVGIVLSVVIVAIVLGLYFGGVLFSYAHTPSCTRVCYLGQCACY